MWVSEQLQILVLTESGSTIVVPVAPTDTIEDVKLKLCDAEGFPPERQRLFRGSIELSMWQTVGRLGLGGDETLHLVMAKRARTG